jgi:multiple sugar transport system ATP-binding protein
VRPEDIGLDTAAGGAGGAGGADQAGRAGGATLAGDVRLVEPLGSEMHVFFSLDAPAAAGEAEAGLLAGHAHNGVARLDPRCAVRPGQRVTFHVNTERLHFFDPDTGAAIR